MTPITTHFIDEWKEARTRFSNQLKDLSTDDLTKKLGDAPNSVGFLIRHIADVELLFAKNVFGLASVKVTAKTVIDKRDTGDWTNLDELLTYAQYAYDALLESVTDKPDDFWEDHVTTKEFGKKTMSEAFGRIVSHTAYHAGQMALAIKYGNNQ